MNNLYLIYGSNYGLIKREIDKIAHGENDVVSFDLSNEKVDEMLDEASCMSLFGTKKILVGQNAFFLTSTPVNVSHDIDYLTRYLTDKDHENVVILSVVSDKLDERKKIVKLLRQNAKVIYKEMIDEKDLPRFVINEFKNDGYEIDYSTARYFVNYVGQNVDIILSEIEKMVIYKDDDNKITMNDINNISCKGLNDNVFDLTDGIMKKDFKKVYECYKDLMFLKEEPIKIIALLANQFLLTYQAKLLSLSGKNSGEIASLLKVHPYRIKLALETDYSVDDLKDVLKKLHELDFNIKTGNLDKTFGLDSFLLHL